MGYYWSDKFLEKVIFSKHFSIIMLHCSLQMIPVCWDPLKKTFLVDVEVLNSCTRKSSIIKLKTDAHKLHGTCPYNMMLINYIFIL